MKAVNIVGIESSPKIKSLELENFTCFGQAALKFSDGINVFIGENGTGKTHILKILYAFLQSYESMQKRRESSYNLKLAFDLILQDFFRPDHKAKLIRKSGGAKAARISILVGNKKNDFELTGETNWNGFSNEFTEIQTCPSLFIPAIEMLTLYEGFTAAYENRQSAFDLTYYLLAKALDPLPIRGPKIAEMVPLLESLRKAGQMEIIKENGKFYVKSSSFDGFGYDCGIPDQKLEAALVAEGLQKIAMLIYLIKNGSLTRNSILFWDEPEAQLNPRLIAVIVDFIITLAKYGVQVFVASHDYFLSHGLSLEAEYRNRPQHVAQLPDMKFFCISKGESGPIIEEGKTLVEIENNPISGEFAEFYNTELRLLASSTGPS